jgi:hypothetical protein
MLMKCVLIALVASLLGPLSAFADTLTFNVRSFHKNSVDIAFYSQNRNQQWPAPGKVYTISDYDVHHYRVDCLTGEKVCYGAWVRNQDSSYWGAGHGGKAGCSGCCYTCNGGQTPTINLNAK